MGSLFTTLQYRQTRSFPQKNPSKKYAKPPNKKNPNNPRYYLVIPPGIDQHEISMTDARHPTVDDARDLEFAISIFDKEDPRSIYNICWEDMKPMLEWMERDHKDLLVKTERQLARSLEPEPVHEMLRLRFWQEYDRAQIVNGRMFLKDIIRGVCDRNVWNKHICREPKVFAYILCPMAKYITLLESSLNYALQEINDILRKPLDHTVLNKRGEKIEIFDTKLAALKIDLFKSLDVRVKGAIIQKLAVKQLVEHKNIDQLESLDLNDLEALEARLTKVKKQITAAQNREQLMLPEVVEGEVIEDRGDLTDASNKKSAGKHIVEGNEFSLTDETATHIVSSEAPIEEAIESNGEETEERFEGEGLEGGSGQEGDRAEQVEGSEASCAHGID